MDKGQAVRDAAVALKNAIMEAIEAGYHIVMPRDHAELDKIAISSTAKAHEQELAERPVQTPQPRPV